MSNDQPKFRAILIVALCAAATLATTADLRAQAAAEKASDDKCLSAPKGAGPAGSHWFYRIDHATKRQCWYLKEAGEKIARSKPQEAASAPSAAAANPTAQPPLTITQKSIANARAEWLSQQARPPAASPAEPQASEADNPEARRNTGGNVLMPAPLASTRWPETTAGSSTADTSAAATDASASPLQETEPSPQPAPPVLAPLTIEPARPTASLQMLLLAIAAALAVAGIIVSVVFRIGRARARRVIRRKREAMWESVPVSHQQPPVRRSPQLQPAPRVEPQRAPRPRLPADREQQMNDMLARLARTVQN